MESILKTAHAEPKRKKFSNPDPLSHVMMLDAWSTTSEAICSP